MIYFGLFLEGVGDVVGFVSKIVDRYDISFLRVYNRADFIENRDK